MSLFQTSLRSSRLVTLPPKYSLQEPSPTRPTQQVLYSPNASRVRQDYGLKAALPKKTKSKHIVLRNLDVIERMTDFDAGDHYWRVLQRFQQFNQSPGNIRPYEIVIKDKKGNISVPNEPITDLDSAERVLSAIHPSKQAMLVSLTPKPKDESCLRIIVDNDTKHSKAQLQRALDSIKEYRSQFRDWFNQQHGLSGRGSHSSVAGLSSSASPFDAIKNQPEKLERAAYEFVSGKSALPSFKSPRDHYRGVQNNAGLSYLPKGMMSNTPYGATISEPVPARFLNVGTGSYEVYGVGGFAVKAPLRRVRHPVHFRESVYNAVISNLNVNQTTGKVNIEIEPSDSMKGTVGIKTLNRTTFQPYTGPYASAATKEFVGKIASPNDANGTSSSSSSPFRNPMSGSSMFSSANLSRNQHNSSSDISRIIGILDPNNRGGNNNVNNNGSENTSNAGRPTFQFNPQNKKGDKE